MSKERHTEYMRQYYREHPEYQAQMKATAKRWKMDNPERMKLIRAAENVRNREAKAAWSINKNRRNRLKVLEHYGMECACCGERLYEFLSIDHIEGGGREHRKQVGHHNFYQWLIANSFPSGFQTLCHNCNLAKGFYGACPHEILKEAIA